VRELRNIFSKGNRDRGRGRRGGGRGRGGRGRGGMVQQLSYFINLVQGQK